LQILPKGKCKEQSFEKFCFWETLKKLVDYNFYFSGVVHIVGKFVLFRLHHLLNKIKILLAQETTNYYLRL
jgi:hypothetical protein